MHIPIYVLCNNTSLYFLLSKIQNLVFPDNSSTYISKLGIKHIVYYYSTVNIYIYTDKYSLGSGKGCDKGIINSGERVEYIRSSDISTFRGVYRRRAIVCCGWMMGRQGVVMGGSIPSFSPEQ